MICTVSRRRGSSCQLHVGVRLAMTYCSQSTGPRRARVTGSLTSRETDRLRSVYLGIAERVETAQRLQSVSGTQAAFACVSSVCRQDAVLSEIIGAACSASVSVPSLRIAASARHDVLIGVDSTEWMRAALRSERRSCNRMCWTEEICCASGVPKKKSWRATT